MESKRASRPKVFVYYFPGYHQDTFQDSFHGDGWTEWELVDSARQRFPDHHQPRLPLAGREDESDPRVMERYIDLAADHGIDGFIFDYYWYEGKPFLDGALDRGFLLSRNREDLEFSLMWANHDWVDVFPSKSPDVPLSDLAKILSVHTTLESFQDFCRHVIEKYFSQPNYTLIDGRPRFSIYEVGNLVSALGGLDQAIIALDWFEDQVQKAGFPGIHLDVVAWSFNILPSEGKGVEPQQLNDFVSLLGARSVSSYVWIHHVDVENPTMAVAKWDAIALAAFEDYRSLASSLSIPFHPNVTAGWDSTPRCDQGVSFELGNYPWFPAWSPGPEEFKQGLEYASEFCSQRNLFYQEVTINAWNEWTEGSYLLPDERDGLGKLKAIVDVFGPRLDRSSSTSGPSSVTDDAGGRDVA